MLCIVGYCGMRWDGMGDRDGVVWGGLMDVDVLSLISVEK